MKKHEFPSVNNARQFTLKDFLGVDFTTHESEVSAQRSPDSINLVTGYQGSIDKRYGTKIEKIYTGKINSISKISYAYRRFEDYYWYNESTESYNLQERYYDVAKEFIVVHNGTELNLGEIDANGDYQHIELIRKLTTATGNSMPFNAGDYPSKLMRINQYTYMLTGTGISVIIDFVRGSNKTSAIGSFGLEADMTDSNAFGDAYSGGTSDVESTPTFWSYMLDIRYIPMAQSKLKMPVTYIAKSPDGTSKTAFESKSLLTAFVSEKFISDGTSTIYKLADSTVTRSVGTDQRGFTLPFYNETTDACIRIRIKNSSGEWVAYTGTYTLSAVNQVTLSTAPAVPTVAGEDNVEITYPTSFPDYRFDSDWGAVRLLSRLTQFEYFGYNGAFNYAFVAYGWDGDFGKVNKDYRITLDDDLTEVYMDENGFSELGNSDSAIIGYFRSGNELVTVTKKIADNPTIFIRSASLDNDGEVIFPIRVGVTGVGALSGTSFASLRDDKLWLSEYGVSALVTNDITGTQAIQDRSFYINKSLLSEVYIDSAYSFIFDNKYFLCVGENIYIADPRNKYAEPLAVSESFQYDWYYWEGLEITSHLVSDGTLYYGTADGRLMSYKNDADPYPYYDEVTTVATTWADATAYAKKAIVSDGAGIPTYYVCLKAHTSETGFHDLTDSYLWNEVIAGTGKFYVPVLAYWTTPVMSMNDITIKKTLKNLWVRLAKYSMTSIRIYYNTQGIVKERYDGIFDFSTIDFSRFTFSTDTDPMVVVTNRQDRKFMSIQFKIESREGYPMGLLEITGKYTQNSTYKG